MCGGNGARDDGVFPGPRVGCGGAGGRRRPPEGQGGHEADADKRAKAGKEPEAARKAGTEQECHRR